MASSMRKIVWDIRCVRGMYQGSLARLLEVSEGLVSKGGVDGCSSSSTEGKEGCVVIMPYVHITRHVLSSHVCIYIYIRARFHERHAASNSHQ